MCGIVGVCRTSPGHEPWLEAGRDALRHRGPDDAGLWWSSDHRVGFGHRRLAILDLTPGGHQPMPGGAGETCVTYNGEIYNFADVRTTLESHGRTFVSRSDTEVLLAAYDHWGADCLAHLSGMFAFGLYDARRRTVLLARDRAGEKPLFYRVAEGRLTFASEIKALLADPACSRRVNPEALDCYLTMGFVPGDRCLVAGVSKLPPAHALRFDLDSGEAMVWRYWSLPSPCIESQVPGGDAHEQALEEELESLLEAAVKSQMVADVPVGVLLSGGVDSSLVTAMAARAQSKVRTYTVGLPGTGVRDESEHAKLVAEHFGTEHTALQVTDVSPDVMDFLARQYDEPIVDSSMIPTFLVSRLIRQHCTVALGGDGGDELFGGYVSHARMAGLAPVLRMVPGAVRRLAASAAGHGLPIGALGREPLLSLAVDPDRGVPLFSPQYDRAARMRLLRNHPGWNFCAEAVRSARVPVCSDPVDRVTRFDFENYMAEDILVKVDRSSMLSSLEVRAPFLDRHVVEFAYSRVPARLKATRTEKKILLKRLVSRLLPSAFDRQRKDGFGIPIGRWLAGGPWRDRIQSLLLDPSCTFDQRAVQAVFDGFDAGRPLKERLFGLALFELWRHEYRMTL